MKKYGIIMLVFITGFVLTACSPKEYTVSFDSNGGSEVSNLVVESGDEATEPALPSKDAYNFVFWYLDDDSVAYDFTKEVKGDIELTALWVDKEIYNVVFDSNGGTDAASQSVMEGEESSEPLEITKFGYALVYWYLSDDSVPFDFSTPVTSDLIISAKWEEKDTYTVTFDATIGSDVLSVDVYVGEKLVLPIEPVEDTHNFVYWYLNDEDIEFDLDEILASDITLTAKWVEKELFAVSFNSNGGTSIDLQVVMEGYLATQPSDPYYLGYSFVRWYETDDNVQFDFDGPITSEITLNALWSIKPVYIVNFDTLGGTVIDSQNIIEDEKILEPVEPLKAGFRFMYWYETDELVPFDVNSNIVSDMTLTAKWELTYTITFDVAGGSDIDPQHLLVTEVSVLPDEPIKSGYRFIRWYETDQEVTFVFGNTISEDITLTALWQREFIVNFYSFGVVYESYTVDEGTIITAPIDPTEIDHVFKYWYFQDSETPLDFDLPIISSMNLQARWETPTERLIMADMDAYEATLTGYDNLLPTPLSGSENQSTLKYYPESLYISESGIILPLPDELPEGTTGTWKVKFTLNYESYYRSFEIPLYHVDEVIIAESRILPFENLTTEYDVADADVTLYYEENGNVPYIKLDDFFSLLQGFIDPSIPMTFTTDVDSLEVFYQYYDEDEDYTYDLILNVDATENTITTNDPAFYWIYIPSTETNYGRHIEYVQDHPDESTLEGDDVVYDLDDYNMDIVMYENEVMLPYYIANQLFAGSAYYNVYYNYDGLYGIYSLPDAGSKDFRTIHQSSMNNEDIPIDLLIHTFDMLAFNFDNLYGLKDIMEVETYYDLLYEMKDDLLVTDPEEFEVAVRDLLLKGIDEPHTSYGYHSYFNNSTYTGPVTNLLSVYGTRFVAWYYDGLLDTDEAIGDKWGEALDGSWNVTVRPDYWFLSDDVVMLSLNGFYTSDIDESATHDALIAEDMLMLNDVSNVLPAISEGDKFFYYNNSDENNRIVDILVKGVDSSYVDIYKTSLVNLGYELVVEATNDELKQDGYYQKTIIDGENVYDYMIVVHYDEQYSLFHVGIATYLPSLYTASWGVINEVESLIFADSAVYMEFMLQEIEEENPNFTEIILDLSWNTGGNVGALYRVIGFITDSPFAVSGIDGDTNGAWTSYVDIVGVPDYSHLNWSLLTTPTSFSAANSLANIFRNNDLGDIIGLTTGGGACSITPILLPNGTAFTMSSNNISAYRTGLGTVEDPYIYHDVEFGITPDFEISITEIFNTTVLLGIINGVN